MNKTIKTAITDLLDIKHPVILAGMNAVSHAELVAAVSNAGGLGVIGGLSLTPKMLRHEIESVKKLLVERDPKKMRFGVDLALPQVGGSARKTNYDYTHGHLPELIDITIEEGASLFVSAVGVPPRWVVDKLHAAGIPVMNMCGHPHHVDKAIAAGCDIMAAQGTEGGGHTGGIATSVLLPMIVDKCRKAKSELTGQRVLVMGAGGIFDGRGLAMSLSLGADAVWVGTRFICAEEAAAPARHQKGVLSANPDQTIRTVIYSGRPLRVLQSDYVMDWEKNRSSEITELCNKGVLPFKHDLEQISKSGKQQNMSKMFPLLMGQAAGAITKIEPAKNIVEGMVKEAIEVIRKNHSQIVSRL